MRRRWAVITTRNGKVDIRRTWTKYGALNLHDRLSFIQAGMPGPDTRILVGELLKDGPGEVTIRYHKG